MPLPLVDRVFMSKPGVSKATYRPGGIVCGSYGNWMSLSMKKAMAAVEKGELTLRKASIQCSVPKSTLHDCLTGKISFNARAGPMPYLTHSEEDELASFLVYTAKIEYPFTRKRVLYLVQQMVEDKGVILAQGQVTNGWWECFKQRHPSIVLKVCCTSFKCQSSCIRSGSNRSLFQYFGGHFEG